MKLRTKLTLLALGVSALPVAIAGYSSLRIGQGALRGALEQNELTVAKQVAGYASSHIDNMLSMLRVDARIFDLTRSARTSAPSAQALNQVLWLVYHQNDDFCAVAMFDEHGALIGKPAYAGGPGPLRVAEEPRADAPHRRRGRRADGAARRGAVGGPGHRPDLPGRAARGCRTSCWRWRSIPSYGGGKRILAAEVSLEAARRTTSRRCRRPTSTSSCSTAAGRLFAAGSIRRRREAGGQRAARRARRRAAAFRDRRRVRRTAAGT